MLVDFDEKLPDLYDCLYCGHPGIDHSPLITDMDECHYAPIGIAYVDLADKCECPEYEPDINKEY